MPYKAFIFYSHAAAGKVAPPLQSALHQFAKPWYKLRALHTFRDETNLSVNPHLWSNIVDALDDSEFFYPARLSTGRAVKVGVQRSGSLAFQMSARDRADCDGT